MNRLRDIRADLVRLDDVWQERDFSKIVEPLHKWTDRNPNAIRNSEKYEKYKRENVYQIKEQEPKNCESNPKPRIFIHIL